MILQVNSSDASAYYSCHDQFVIIDKAVDCRRRSGSPLKTSVVLKEQLHPHVPRLSHSQGIGCWI